MTMRESISFWREPDITLRAISKARASLNLSQPNPLVGCILVSPDGHVAGEGYTQQAGGPHAEVMALQIAMA